jgi:adenosylhomocysteine nucleosidase
MSSKIDSSILVVMALEAEAQGRLQAEGAEVLFTGIGKVNASYRLTRRLTELAARGQRPWVVNFGTAGSRHFATGSLVSCHSFVQRDMDVVGLGFAHGQTPFEALPRVLEFPPLLPQLPAAVCASGDSFETGHHDAEFQVVDMEAYALAKVCLLEGVVFACAKYISDGADEHAGMTWESALPHAAAAFVEVYRQLRTRAEQAG